MTNFQFSKKPAFRLVVIAIVCIVLGAVIGLVLNYQTLKELREGPKTLPTPATQVEEEEEKLATYSGTIKPAGKLYQEGTHYLEDATGKMILLLESSKIDLGLIEGWEVEVEGEVKDAVEGDKKIMEVDEVRL